MPFSRNAINLLQTRYCHVGETPEGVFKRVAKALAIRDEKFEKELYDLMTNGIFLPNSPAIRNAGKKKGCLSACFVLNIEDNISSIFEAIRDMALIFQRGGGTGFNFSKLRAKNMALATGGTSSGPVSFMSIFDNVTEVVKQGGMRRGASMFILDSNHPDVFDFARSKLSRTLTNANLSVLVTDEFMKAATSKKSSVQTTRAKNLLDIIALGTWNNGDPGLLFHDRINQDNPRYPEIDIRATNPCVTGDTQVLTNTGAYPIADIERSDDVVSIWNGVEFSTVRPTVTGRNQPIVRVSADTGCGETIVLDCTPYHTFYLLDGSKVKARDLMPGDLVPYCRGVGEPIVPVHITSITPHGTAAYVYCFYEPKRHMGVFNGFLTGQCGEQPLPDYGSCCLGSINISKFVECDNFNFERFYDVAKLGARALLNVNIVNYYPIPAIAKVSHELNSIGLGIMGFSDALIKLGIRYNSNDCLDFIRKLKEPYVKATNEVAPDSFYKRSIAPTGSLSLIADCSPSIEPIFAKEFERHLVAGVFHETRPFYDSECAISAHEVSPDWHLKIQAEFQKFVDSGVSKTCNAPYDISIEEIKDIYIKAWKLGCKGITIFRDQSIDGVIKPVSKCEGETCSL